jgi:2-polyprenyl-6-methoxyphenol hydroxylase-like FAD-dependent oxidoreductase
MRHQDKPVLAIVGAGIGGLAAAAALRKFFFDPVLYEQADTFSRVGAGLQQSPNAVKVYRWLGIEDRLRQMAFAPESAINRDSVTGKITSEHPLGREIETRYGAPYLTLHRADLHAALGATVPAHSIKRGKTLARIAANGKRIQLVFADGSEAEADAVIGADGVHSLIREHVAGPGKSRFTGRVLSRTTFPSSLLSNVELAPALTAWWGRDRHVLAYFVTAARDHLHVSTSQPAKPDNALKESWSAKGDPADVRAAFANFPLDVQRLLAAASDVGVGAIHQHDPLPEWSKGRVVLLGDACHPMTPDMAAPGAAMALEDAVVLARAIDQADSFEAAFRFYETARKPRANAVQAGASKNIWMRSDTSPDWLYGYDASRVPLRSSLAADASTYYES